MKILFFFLMSAFIISCHSTQHLSINEIEKYGNSEPLPDSIIRSLQQENDLVIAFATESYAWIRSTTYLILCKKENDWAGYYYYRNNMPRPKDETGDPFNINPVAVDKAVGDSLLNYIIENRVWSIQGDNGKGFCTTASAQCNINDAATQRLWVITKTKYINPAYYAPEFFENCCPGNEERKLFLTITGKIQNIVTVQGSSR